MGLLTKQDIDNFYKDYRNEEVVFNKAVSNSIGLQSKHIYLKFKDIQRPCIIYSSSMARVKIISSLTENIIAGMKDDHNISIRFAVNNEDKKNDLLFFFVKCKLLEVTPYKVDQNLYIIEFEYTSRPSEVLVTILGRIIEAGKNSVERKDERIIITKENAVKLGLRSTGVNITIDNIPRQAVIRDLSFGGIKVLLAGNAKFLQNKAVKLVISHKDEDYTLLGKSIRTEFLPTRKDIVAMAILFDKQTIPLEYNLMINGYLKSNKVRNIKENSETSKTADKLQ